MSWCFTRLCCNTYLLKPQCFVVLTWHSAPLLSDTARHLISDHRLMSRLAPLTSVSETPNTPWPPICHPSVSSPESQTRQSCQFLHSKTNTVSLLHARHAQGVIFYPKVVPEWQLSSLLQIIHVLGHHFVIVQCSLPPQSHWIIRLAIYNYALD